MDKIKNIILRKKSGRDNSPGPPTPVIFSAGKISHPHISIAPHEMPSKYILLHVSHAGSILPIDIDSPYILGYLICECSAVDQYTQAEKNIVFVPSSFSPDIPDPGPQGHFIQSSICLPDLNFVQSMTNKSWPLFYRLPLEMQQQASVKEMDTDMILSNVIRQLTALSDNIDNEEVDTVYQALFDTLVEPPRGRPISRSSSSPSYSLPPAPGELIPSTTLSQRPENILETGLSRGGPHQQGGATGAVPRTFPSLPPPPHHNHSAWGTKEPLGIVIYKFPSLDLWHSICGENLEKTQKESIKNALKGLKKPTFGVLILPNQERTSVDFFLMTMTIFEKLSTQSTTHPVCKFQGITYTLMDNDSIMKCFGGLVKFLSLAQEQALTWFKAVVEAIQKNTLIFKCSLCDFECVQSSHLRQHVHSRHNNQSATHTNKGNGFMGFSSDDEEDNVTYHPHSPAKMTHRDPGSILTNSVPTFTPKILEEVDCPKSYIRFWKMRANERRMTREGLPQSRWVAPRYPLSLLAMETHVNFSGLLEAEFISYAKAYQSYITQVNWASVEGNGAVQLEIFNDAAQLTILGKGRILDDLRKQAPSLENKNLSSLTEASVQSFFSQSRFYALSSSIPHDSWSDFFLTNAALGAEILSRVKETLAGFPTYKAILKNFSCFIERILITLLPAQESYADTENRMLEAHRSHLLGPSANVDYTRTRLMADSRELVSKSPYFKQVQGSISEAEKRFLIEGCKTNLLFKVISNTIFEAKLHKLLIASDKFSQLDEIPYNVLLDHIQSLITADKKSEVAYVNATKGRATSSQSSGRFSKHSSRSPARRSPPPSPRSPRGRSSGRSSPATSPHRRSNPKKNLQDRCDICKQMRFPDYFCVGGNHCRMPHHQQPVKNPIDFKRRVEAREPNLFVTFDKCPLCKGQSPTTSKWVQPTSSSVVTIPKDFFNQPFTLHPQSIADLAQQLSRMPPPAGSYPHSSFQRHQGTSYDQRPR